MDAVVFSAPAIGLQIFQHVRWQVGQSATIWRGSQRSNKPSSLNCLAVYRTAWCPGYKAMDAAHPVFLMRGCWDVVCECHCLVYTATDWTGLFSSRKCLGNFVFLLAASTITFPVFAIWLTHQEKHEISEDSCDGVVYGEQFRKSVGA